MLPQDAVPHIDEADLVPVNYHLNRKGSRLLGNGNANASQASFISDLSNLTAKEEEIEKEKQELEREIQERMRANLKEKM